MSAAEDYSDDDLPRPFGGYLLLQNFARGGMGEVYLAKSGGIAGLERTCVLKKLRSELTRDREYVTRFIDEARVVVTLNHANICNVFDVGRVGEEYYLAMEYVSGRDVRTLQDRCRKAQTPMSPATALHLVCETLQALDYAHRRKHPVTGEPLNLVHRDVSPQNVLVSYEGEVKLIDFGLAASRLKVERTQPNVVMGKMAYMAPEQARGDPIDARADLFACGVLAYELLTNERFYEAMTANDIWQVAGRGGFVPRAWGTLDGALATILSRGLHPDPKKRFASCGDFREALVGYMHERWPGAGGRMLRGVMETVFAEEMNRERAALAKFGTITIAAFRTEIESTQSHSISLAKDTVDGPDPQGARLVRNELGQSSNLSGQMPPPDLATERPARSTDEGTPVASERPGLHDDETALGAERPILGPGRSGRIHDEKTVVTNPSQRSLKARQQAEQAERDVADEEARQASKKERTQLVRPGMLRRDDVDDSVTDGVPGDTTSFDLRGRRNLVVGGAAALAVVIVAAAFAVAHRGGDDVKPPPVAALTTTTTTTTPTTTPAPTPLPTLAPVELAPLTAKTEPPPPTTTVKTEPPKTEPKTPKTPRTETPKATTTTTPKTEPPPPPKTAAVDKPFWEGLLRKHTSAPCVKALTAESFALGGRFLGERQSEIRACAAQVGFKKS